MVGIFPRVVVVVGERSLVSHRVPVLTQMYYFSVRFLLRVLEQCCIGLGLAEWSNKVEVQSVSHSSRRASGTLHFTAKKYVRSFAVLI